MYKVVKLVIFVALLSVTLAGDEDALDKRQAQYYNPVQQVYKAGPQYAILRLENEILPDGSYHYAYDTENGISAQESGAQKALGNTAGTAAQGSYQYTSPEGVPVQIQYIADENGFQPSGNVLPTPPPIPPAILRSIEYNLAHPEPQQQVQPQPQYYRQQL